MKRLLIIICFIIASCSTDDNNNQEAHNTSLLSNDIEGRTIEIGAVIACAANTIDDTSVVEIYFYPESNAQNFKVYETNTADVDPNDFSNYRAISITDEPFFNGSLRKFVRPFALEQWIVVTYEIDGDIKLSNPIRTKNLSQSTLGSNEISINQEQSQMPIFSWEVASEAVNAIFFQVVSTVDNSLISGTYTYETNFQYYNTSNVVLNITDGTPPNLTSGQTYKFTVMDVSEDNWVNEVFVTQFVLE